MKQAIHPRIKDISPPIPDLRATRSRRRSVVITGVVGFHQLDHVSCGTAAIETIIRAYVGCGDADSWFTAVRYTNPKVHGGTSTRRLRRALHEVGFESRYTRTFNADKVSEILRQGDLIITAVRVPVGEGYRGHWVVVAGCSPRDVLLLNATGLPLFSKRWIPWDEIHETRGRSYPVVQVRTGLTDWVSDRYPAVDDPCPQSTSPVQQALESVREAAAYLRYSGIHLPRFKITAEPYGPYPVGGSFVTGFSSQQLRVNMGRYPSEFLRRWFAMHELGHVLWHQHRPLRWKRFRQEFGEPKPENYDGMASKEAWKTSATAKASWFPGPHRPKGQPSLYGIRGGGQERFCELLGLMWAHGDFASKPPADLSELWDVGWGHGLERMT